MPITLYPARIGVTPYNVIVYDRGYVDFTVYNQNPFEVTFDVYVDDKPIYTGEKLGPNEYRYYKIDSAWYNRVEGRHRVTVRVVGYGLTGEAGFDFTHLNSGPSVIVFKDENNHTLLGNFAVTDLQNAAYQLWVNTVSGINKPKEYKGFLLYEFWKVNKDGTIYYGLVKDNRIDYNTYVKMAKARRVVVEYRIPIPKNVARAIAVSYLGAIYGSTILVTTALLQIVRSVVRLPLKYLRVEEDANNYWIIYGVEVDAKSLVKGVAWAALIPLLKVIIVAVAVSVTAYIIANMVVTVSNNIVRAEEERRKSLSVLEKLKNNVVQAILNSNLPANQKVKLIEDILANYKDVLNSLGPPPTSMFGELEKIVMLILVAVIISSVLGLLKR